MAEQPKKKKISRHRAGFIARTRGNFLTGLVVVLPVSLTIWALWSFVGFVDNRVVPLVPDVYNPATYIGINIRGFGVVVFLLFTTFIGAVAKGLFGRQLLRFGESMIDRVPLVRTIYNGVKQIVETITTSNAKSFEKACLVEYPRKGIWAIAFISTESSGEILTKSGEPEMMSVFLPTTPNPTSGFLLFVPKKDVVVLDMDVEEAAKLVISAGLVMPPSAAEKAAKKAKIAQTKTNAKPKTLA